jgi:outer membrane lipoprotein-sorting protein
MELGRRRRLRWAVPAGAVVMVAALIAGTEAATAQSSPALPSRTAASLLAELVRPAGPVPLTGTYTETAALGLPDLPGAGDPLSGASLLAGTHTFMIWSGGAAQELRIAEPVSLGEADVRQFGNQVWVWNSRTQRATHIVLPATFGSPAPGSLPSGSASPSPGSSSSASSSSASFSAGPQPATPQQLARRILAAVGPTTVVSVAGNVTVAGQAAYQLALAPKDRRSLIGRVTIAVDAGHDLPLRVQVTARGGSAPAFQAGYTALSLGAPALSNFMFTPPAGAKVTTIQVPATPPHPFFRGRHPASPPATPGGTSSGGRAAPQNAVPATVVINPATGRARTVLRPNMHGGSDPAAGRPFVTGAGWLAVLVVPPAATARSTTAQTAIYSDGARLIGYSTSAVTVPTATPFAAPGAAGLSPAVLRALLKAATPVHGRWGSGRLLRTSLLSVLLTSNGTVLAGAVTPAVLYADAARLP